MIASRKIFARSTKTVSFAIVGLLTFSAYGQANQCLPTEPVDCSGDWYVNIIPVVAGYSKVFGKACMTHDYCYRFGSKTYGYSRFYCDRRFLSDMRTICNDVNWRDVITLGLNTAACHIAADAAFGIVRLAGGSAYKPAASANFCEYAGPSPLPRVPTILGGVNANTYCQAVHGAGYRAVALGNAATDWRCQKPGAPTFGISIQLACEQQYSNRPIQAVTIPPGNATAWRCQG